MILAIFAGYIKNFAVMKSDDFDRNGVGDKKLSDAVIRSMHPCINMPSIRL